ncbi:MAG: cupredoxin domain-containing protein [Candidatus Rokuibacteriota bacterium]
MDVRGVLGPAARQSGLRGAKRAMLLLGALALGAGGGRGPDGSGPAPSAAWGQPRAFEIAVSNNMFQPKEATVRAGTPVLWTQKGEGRHAVTAADGSFKSEILGAGGSFRFTPMKVGKIPYYCRFHGDAEGNDMAGVLDVRAAN